MANYEDAMNQEAQDNVAYYTGQINAVVRQSIKIAQALVGEEVQEKEMDAKSRSGKLDEQLGNLDYILHSVHTLKDFLDQISEMVY